MHPAQYLRRKQAAAYLKPKYGFGAAQTLARLAVVGGGPQMVYAGRIPLYTEEWLDEWAQGKLTTPVRSTTEGKEARGRLANSVDIAEVR
jgi:hypothetical protein